MNERNGELDEVGWHLDKRVPITLIFGMLVQTACFVWWASDLTARVTYLEASAERSIDRADRLTRVEDLATSNTQSLARIEEKLDRLMDRYR